MEFWNDKIIFDILRDIKFLVKFCDIVKYNFYVFNYVWNFLLWRFGNLFVWIMGVIVIFY